MSLRIFEGIGVIVVILAIMVGGLYFYSIGQEDDIILELTFEQLQTLEKPDVVAFDASTQTILESADPEVPPQPIVLPTQVEGSVTADIVTVTSEAGNLSFTVEEFLATNPFGDIEVWLEEIRAGNYEVESRGEGDEAVWIYTLASEELEQSYVQTLASQFIQIVAAGAGGAAIENPQISFDGNMEFVVVIGSSDNIIDSLDITADVPIVLNYDITLDELGTVSTASNFTVVETNVVYTEFTLQDGQSIPTNPLLVLLASFM